MVGTNASTNEKHKFYNSTVQAISIGGGECYTKFGALCARFVYMVAPVKSRWEMGLVRFLISGDIPLMCLTRPFSP